MYDILARYYDELHAVLDEDIELVLSLAAEAGGAVLELGCGTGRLLVPLARAGHHVTGVDNSTPMLERARARLASEHEKVRKRVELVNMDARTLALPGQERHFALALFPYNTPLHFLPTEIGQTLRAVRPLLRPGGQLFIDVLNPFVLEAMEPDPEPVLERTFLDAESGERIFQFNHMRLDRAQQTLNVTWTFTIVSAARDGSGDSVEIPYHYLYPHQWEIEVAQAGFRLERMLGSYEGEVFTEDSERLLLLARVT